MFGIAWGVISITLMAAAGEGLRVGQQQQATIPAAPPGRGRTSRPQSRATRRRVVTSSLNKGTAPHRVARITAPSAARFQPRDVPPQGVRFVVPSASTTSKIRLPPRPSPTGLSEGQNVTTAADVRGFVTEPRPFFALARGVLLHRLPSQHTALTMAALRRIEPCPLAKQFERSGIYEG
jgi:hypothetical protein